MTILKGPKVLANELIGFQIAALLGLEHLEVGVIDVDEIALGGPELWVTFADGTLWDEPFRPGLAFYSRWLSNANQVSHEDVGRFMGLQNPKLLAGAVVLDLLLNNWDRSPSNLNLLLHRDRERQCRLERFALELLGGWAGIVRGCTGRVNCHGFSRSPSHTGNRHVVCRTDVRGRIGACRIGSTERF